MNVTIIPKTILRYLLITILFLLIGNILVNILKFSDLGDLRITEIIIEFFDFDIEENLPTFYSSFALLTASLLLFGIASFYRTNKVGYLHWLGFAFIFAFLAIDEFTVIHEYLWQPTKDLLNTSGLLYGAWYIPYGIFFLFIAGFYVRWFLRLPKRTKSLFFISGVIFLAGAVAFEAIAGYYQELYGVKNYMYCISYTIEELLEMCGIAIFIFALLDYIGKDIGFLNINFLS